MHAASVAILLAAIHGASDDSSGPPPGELQVGTEGRFRPSALIQTWFVLDRSPPAGCLSDGCTLLTSTFRIRRAEMVFLGAIIPGSLEYRVSIDPARLLEFRSAALAVANLPAGSARETVSALQPSAFSSVLNDVFVTFDSSVGDVTAGQFRTPVGYEGSRPSSQLIFPERAVVERVLDDRRDMGIRMSKTFDKLGYTVALLDGSGQNVLDTNNGKDGSLRLEAYPIDGMTLALVGYSTLWRRHQAGAKDRWEADFHYERGPIVLLGELIRGRDLGSSGWVEAFGWQAVAGFTLFKALQPVVRVGYFDPHMGALPKPANAASADLALNTLEVGLNYYILKQEAKLQLTLGRFAFEGQPAELQGIGAVQLYF